MRAAAVVAFVFVALLALIPAHTVPVVLETEKGGETEQQLPEAAPCSAKLCFAIDGSQSVSPAGFALQKKFVIRLLKYLQSQNHTLELAAVQYGLENNAVSPLTRDAAQFVERVNNAAFGSSGSTFVRGGIVYCDFELTSTEPGVGSIVVLGDGRGNFGGDPVRSARLFREIGGRVYAVGIGHVDDKHLTEIVGGDSSKVLHLHSEREIDEAVRFFDTWICSSSA